MGGGGRGEGGEGGGWGWGDREKDSIAGSVYYNEGLYRQRSVLSRQQSS